MSLKKYLKDHRLHLLLGLLAEGLVEAVLWLFASPVALQGFAFFWLTGSIGVIFGYDFLRKRKFYKKVEKTAGESPSPGRVKKYEKPDGEARPASVCSGARAQVLRAGGPPQRYFAIKSGRSSFAAETVTVMVSPFCSATLSSI